MRLTWRAAAIAALFVNAMPLGGQVATSPGPGAGQTVRSSSALPPSTLSVVANERWVEWWSSEKAPSRWSTGEGVLANLVEWTRVAEGVEHAELTLGGDEAFRTRLVLVRLDPSRVQLELDTSLTPRMRPSWTVADAPDDALFAVNAGQFVRALPWGWVVLAGEQFLAPGTGPLATAVTIDSAGRIGWQHGTLTAPARRPVVWAFQSYPTLLVDHEIPLPLRGSGNGIDAEHRDARLAMGSLADGRLIVAMTRFDALGPALGVIPLGLTTPEMAAVMGSLGVRDAVMLDGGISAQMMFRTPGGSVRSWRGLRPVPLALIARARR